MISLRRFLISLLVVLSATTAALAADKTAGEKKLPPVSSEPETTTASYDAWTLTCQRHKQGQKTCEISESVVPHNQQSPIARIGIGHRIGTKRGALEISVILPANIYIPTAPRIKAKDDLPGFTLAWQRCFPGGCFAEAALPPGEIKIWRSIEANTGRIAFTEAAGHKLAIQFSLRGFAQALEALDKVKS